MYPMLIRCARLHVVAIALVTGALSACGKPAEGQTAAAPGVVVSVVPATQRSITDVETFSGRIETAEFVELRPRVSGTIDQVHFIDGTVVSAGQLLFSIDPRPLQAEVMRAEAELSAAISRAELAQTELARAQQLLDGKAVSRQEFDQLSARARTSEADRKVAEAALRVAQLNLGYTSVRAPIAGRVSRAAVTAGNLVDDQQVLTTIAATDRVYAYFDCSEQSFLRVTALGDARTAVAMGLAHEDGFPHQGNLDFIDNRLNPQTGSIRLRATFDNRDGRFVPGLAARLRMATSAPYVATLVPERAIGTDQNRKTVVVIGADGMPQFRAVELGTLQNGMRVILGGAVQPGEHVVVDGLLRIIPGVPVQAQQLEVDELGLPVYPPTAASPSADR